MTQPKVLIVDDEPMNLELAGAILRREGYGVATACNGKEALAACDIERFDLVLMDINMPVMDGFTAMRTLRANPATKNLAIVVVTGSTSGAEEKSAIEAGADVFLSKPYRRRDMLLALEKVQGMRRMPPAFRPL